MIEITSYDDYEEFVVSLAKHPSKVNLNYQKIDLLHAAIGISGEAGEIIDTVKKHCYYDQRLDKQNIKEELGDIYFYMTLMMALLGLTRDDVVQHNMSKLKKRYPNGFTNESAKKRLDKQNEI